MADVDHFESNSLFDGGDGVGHFIVEGFSLDVGNDRKMGMTGPSIESLLIEGSCGFESLRSGGVV